MAADRLTIYKALFALVSQGEGLAGKPSVTWGSGATFVVTSRKIKLFNAVPAEMRPSFMQAEHDEQQTQVSNIPAKRILKAHWVIYTNAGRDTDAIPSDEINSILTALEGALAPPPSDPGYPKRNTLGGLVWHCYLDGQIFKDPGDLDGDGLLMVPITILAP